VLSIGIESDAEYPRGDRSIGTEYLLALLLRVFICQGWLVGGHSFMISISFLSFPASRRASCKGWASTYLTYLAFFVCACMQRKLPPPHPHTKERKFLIGGWLLLSVLVIGKLHSVVLFYFYFYFYTVVITDLT
jgi:hypothetical protein